VKAILAIDQGTTSTRAIAFSVNGKKLFSSQLEFKQLFPKNGWVEHNPNEIWSKTLKVIKNVTKKCIRKKIGVVLQHPSYEPTLSVEKSLEKYGMMWDLDKKTRMDRTEELLVAFNLVEIRKKRNEDLSIGQRRRVQVAREFMHDMDLLFLDEPTVGLDPTARRQLLDFLKNKVKEKNLTIFYTTHVLTEAEYLCDNIAIINKGKIITVDSPNELKKRFGREKTIKIHVSSNTETLGSLLENIQDCKIEFNTGAIITIHSADSELVLMNILKILNQNNIAIDDLSAIPTNLEEIFLKVVSDSNASDNQTS